MYEWIAHWFNKMVDHAGHKSLDSHPTQESPPPQQHGPKTIDQYKREAKALKAKLRRAEEECQRLAKSLTAANNTTEPMQWISWDKEQPYESNEGRINDLLLLMASGKTIRATVETKVRTSGGDMFSGTHYDLVSSWGERISGTPVAWMVLKMPDGFYGTLR